jgi:teichuronic acid biosynthesis glycosyltransferase TuaC
MDLAACRALSSSCDGSSVCVVSRSNLSPGDDLSFGSNSKISPPLNHFRNLPHVGCGQADWKLGVSVMTERLRVLVLVNNFPDTEQPYAGVFVLRQLEALRAHNIEARVIRFVPWAPPLGRRWMSYRRIPKRYVIANFDVRVVRVLLLPRLGFMQTLTQQVRRFLSVQISEFKPHLLHAHQVLPTGLLAVGHRLPLIVTAHGSDAYDYPYRNRIFRAAARQVLTNASRVIAVSRFVAAKTEELGARSVTVVYNGADPNVFYPRDRTAARRRLGIEENRRVVLFAGHVCEAKGVFDLINALANLADLTPLLVIAGTGPDTLRIMDRCTTLNVAFRVFGPVEHVKLAELLGAADVVALPSYREGLPAVLCEAMLSQTPIIASKVGGIPEIVINGRTGYLVEPGSISTLSYALRQVLTDTTTARNMARMARTFACKHLTWSVNAASYLQIFRSTVRQAAADTMELK